MIGKGQASALRAPVEVVAPATTAVHVVTLVLPRDELRQLIMSGLAEALDAQGPRPKWLDMDGVATHLAVSTPTVKKLCVEGMPHVMVGDHRRFDPGAVDAWLVERAARKAGE